jgi:GLPGLI family protein
MKKSLLFFLFLTCGLVSMQAQMKEGYIKMEITEVGSDNEQMAMQLEMLKGSQTEIYFSEDKTLTKMNMMGGMMETTSLYSMKEGKTDILMNMMGKKIHIETSDAEVDKMKKEAGDAMKDIDIKYDESDKRTILGYECTKATFSGANLQGSEVIMYITKEIEGSVKGMQMIGSLEFEGFPLMVTIDNPQMSMTFEAVDLKKELEGGVFDINTGGFQKMSMKEFQEQIGQMGASFGF